MVRSRLPERGLCRAALAAAALLIACQYPALAQDLLQGPPETLSEMAAPGISAPEDGAAESDDAAAELASAVAARALVALNTFDAASFAGSTDAALKDFTPSGRAAYKKALDNAGAARAVAKSGIRSAADVSGIPAAAGAGDSFTVTVPLEIVRTTGEEITIRRVRATATLVRRDGVFRIDRAEPIPVGE